MRRERERHRKREMRERRGGRITMHEKQDHLRFGHCMSLTEGMEGKGDERERVSKGGCM